MWSIGGLGSMPSTAVGIGFRICHVGQRLVHELSFWDRRGPVCRRSDERMAKAHPYAELSEPVGNRGCGRVGVDAHYFTDIIAGSLWGAWFTVMTRNWFARRGLVFLPGAGHAPMPMPRRRLGQAFAAFARRLRG